MIDRLRLALARHEKSKPGTGSEILAAVLIPVFIKNGEYHLLFTKRTDLVKTHKGEICFPGGHYEPEDITMLKTALRETQEEVGIAPEDVQVVGELDSTVNASSGYVITSYIGFIPYPHALKLEEREIVEALEVPISFLLNPANLRQETWDYHGRRINVECYNFHERIIWGATGRILKIFLPVWADAASKKPL